MKQEFHEIREEIAVVLNNWLDEAEQNQTLFSYDKKWWQMLREFVCAGKFFRACLLVGSVDRLSQTAEHHKLAVQIGAIVEMYESGILIQDDVMDGDERRRGKLSIHMQIAHLEGPDKVIQRQKMAESIATCLGDILFFYAQLKLSSIEAESSIKKEIERSLAGEMLLLGLAQIEDIKLADAENVNKEDILQMFLGKTGRYSGRWPIELALIIAKFPEENRKKCIAVAEKIGLLYQLRDDYLGMFGDQQKTGKNTVSDVHQGKKTLYWWYATQLLTGTDNQVFKQIYGNQHATLEQMEQIKTLFIEKNITQTVDQEIKTIADSVFANINNLPVNDDVKFYWSDITQLILERNK